MDFETFTTDEVSDEPTASEVAAAISTAFNRPEVTRVIAVFEEDAVEFDASDIGQIHALHGAVHGMIRETPSIDSFDGLRIREKPWITDRLDEMREMEVGATVRVRYQSRFGNEVEKTITLSDVDIQMTKPPYGYDIGDEQANLDMVAAFGFDEGDEFALMAQSNGGVNVLMNDTRVIEPGTFPTFEVIEEVDDE